MKSIILTITIVLAAGVSLAQQKKLKFHSINSIAITGGESPAAAAYETVNGFGFSSWFAGLGASLDNYHFQSIPVFLDSRKYFGNEKQLFLFGNIGGNFPVQKQAAKEFSYQDDYYFKGGFYADAGIGYRFPVKKTSLVFSVSNSYKSMQGRSVNYVECLVAPCPVSFKDYYYNFYRVMIKAGVMF